MCSVIILTQFRNSHYNTSHLNVVTTLYVMILHPFFVNGDSVPQHIIHSPYLLFWSYFNLLFAILSIKVGSLQDPRQAVEL